MLNWTLWYLTHKAFFSIWYHVLEIIIGIANQSILFANLRLMKFYMLVESKSTIATVIVCGYVILVEGCMEILGTSPMDCCSISCSKVLVLFQTVICFPHWFVHKMGWLLRWVNIFVVPCICDLMTIFCHNCNVLWSFVPTFLCLIAGVLGMIEKGCVGLLWKVNEWLVLCWSILLSFCELGQTLLPSPKFRHWNIAPQPWYPFEATLEESV